MTYSWLQISCIYLRCSMEFTKELLNPVRETEEEIIKLPVFSNCSLEQTDSIRQ